MAKTSKQLPKLFKTLSEQLKRPKTTSTVGKAWKPREFNPSASGVPDAQTPLSAWGKAKRIFLSFFQMYQGGS